MKFMIMVFDEESRLHAKPREWVEAMTAFMVQLDDELAHSGELVYSEVLEYGNSATLVDRHGGFHRGSFTGSGSPLSRFWVVKVAADARAIEIAATIAVVVEGAVEVRQVMQPSQRP